MGWRLIWKNAYSSSLDRDQMEERLDKLKRDRRPQKGQSREEHNAKIEALEYLIEKDDLSDEDDD